MMDYLHRCRTISAFWLFLAGFMLLGIRLYYLQVSSSSELAARAEAQQNQIVGLEEVPRGDIFDRNRVSLTGGTLVRKVVVFPHLINDKFLVIQRLSQLLGMPLRDLQQLTKEKPVLLDIELNDFQATNINQAKLPGVRIYKVKKRYAAQPLAVHFIGHLGKMSEKEIKELDIEIPVVFGGNSGSPPAKPYRSTDLVGKMGLEKYYETELKGSTYETYVAVPTDARKRPLRGLGIIEGSKTDAVRKHLVLTIDSRIQAIVEKVLAENKVGSGSAVVMEVTSGDILAMASRPSFDPSNIQATIEGSVYGNEFLDNSVQLVQPGSVFKPLVAAAALETGAVQADTRFLCLGAGDELVRCYRSEGHGLLNFSEAMALSCNPVFARVGQKVGADQIIEFATRLGLARPEIIGYPIPQDHRQDLQKLKEPYTLVNGSIGQGPVLATPVQITAMMASFARGGVYKKPRLVIEVLDAGFNREKHFAADKGSRVISAENCLILQDMFAGATSYGTGAKAFVPGWGSAGKTGSAQINKYQGIVDAWFTGYAPLVNPRYAVTVMINGGESGGRNAAPLFRQIAERIMELEEHR